MVIGGVVLAFVLVAGGLVYSMMLYKKTDAKHAILEELGLIQVWAKEKPTPFYKWNWKSANDDRIWAERIVRNAFDNAGVWLSEGDYQFFHGCCDAHASGETIPNEHIEKRVDQILHRITYIHDHILKQLTDKIDFCLKVSDSEMKSVVQKRGLKVSPKQAPLQFGRLQIREWMNEIAYSMTGPGGDGVKIKDLRNRVDIQMTGMDSLRFWAQSCFDLLPKVHTKKQHKDHPNLNRDLKSVVVAAVFQDFVNDGKHIRSMRSKLDSEIDQGKLEIDPSRLDALEGIFCQWLYTPEISFSRKDFSNVREFITRGDVSPAFRSIIINTISSNFGSLHASVNRFPDKVIFYGANVEARTMISKRYTRHLYEMRKALGALTETTRKPPALLFVTDADVQYHRELFEGVEQEVLVIEDEEGKRIEIPRQYMPHLIDIQKKFSRFERSIDDLSAEMCGWVVDLGVDDFSAAEAAHLDKGKYKKYIRVLCQPKVKFEIGKDTQQQEEFWKEMLNECVSRNKSL